MGYLHQFDNLGQGGLGLHEQARNVNHDMGATGRGQTEVARTGRVIGVGIGEVVAHQLADLFATVGDPLAVREALLLALAVGDVSQREHAQARLHAISRDLKDQVGARRWRTFQRPSLVSLSPTPRTPSTRSAAPRLARWRDQLEAVAVPS